MHAKQRNEAIRHVVAYVFTIAMVFLAVIPFIYVVLTALKTKEQIYDPSQIIPTHITFDNFRQVLFQSNFVRYFMNSIFYYTGHNTDLYDIISNGSIWTY